MTDTLPDLVGRTEIAERCHISIPGCKFWTNGSTSNQPFPEPVYRLAMGDAWLWDDVLAWLRATDRMHYLQGKPDKRPRRTKNPAPAPSQPQKVPTMLTFTNEPFAPLNVVFTKPGERNHRAARLVNQYPEPIVEFFDSRYPQEVHGQFISDYLLSTLLDTEGLESHGLDLQGDQPNWTASAETMTALVPYLYALASQS